MSILRRLVSAAKGAIWVIRPQGLRHQLNHVEGQLDHVHTLFDHWQQRFNDLFVHFERQAQAVLPDVVERQNQLGDKLSQLNAGFGAREARITKWLMDIEQHGRQLLEDLKSQQEQISRLQAALNERAMSQRSTASEQNHLSESDSAESAEATVSTE